MKTIDIHIHGGFGINFDKANQTRIRDFAIQAKEKGIEAFCPALTGDTPEKLREKLQIIKDVKLSQKPNEAKIIGANLEGTFLNPKKSGIQDPKVFLEPTIENFEAVTKGVNDIVKIVVLAPEIRDYMVFSEYLRSKNIKVHYGHTLTDKIEGADGICHMYNAMEQLTHKKSTLVSKALLSDGIYTELIADTKHVNIDILKLTFKLRPVDRILLISDALPLAGSKLGKIEFCGKTIYSDGKDDKGTLGGSVMLLPEIAQNLVDKCILPKEKVQKMVYYNQINYLRLIV